MKLEWAQDKNGSFSSQTLEGKVRYAIKGPLPSGSYLLGIWMDDDIPDPDDEDGVTRCRTFEEPVSLAQKHADKMEKFKTKIGKLAMK